MAEKDVIVLGGGLAGIAASVRLLQNGVSPTLIERRPFLGGRAFSFIDRDTNEEIDNGQHVILGVCHEFLDLLDVLGTRDDIELGSTLDVPVSFQGSVSSLKASRLIGNIAALVRYRHLSIRDRILVARMMFTIKLSRPDQSETDQRKRVSFARWLRDHGQSEAAVTRFWSLFILPVFNCRIEDVTAHEAIQFISVALLGPTDYAAIGYPKMGLSTLIGKPAEAFLRSKGADLLTNVRVESLNLDDDEVEVRLSDGTTLTTKTVVSCLPPNALARVLPDHDPDIAGIRSTLEAFEYSPIVAVHLWYERPIMSESLTAFVDQGLQWVFNDSALRGKTSDDAQHIVISLSSADEWAALSKDAILHRIQEKIQTVFPDARGNNLVNSAVVKTPEATIKIAPQSDAHRIGPSTGRPSLFLAGDWTDTSLPATMEGAVQSGNLAASMALDVLGSRGA